MSNKNLPLEIQNKLIEEIKAIKPKEIWLFGSYAKGNPTSASDIDIFVVKKKIKKDFHKDVVKLRNELNKFQKNYGIDVDLFIDTKDNIKEKLLNGDVFYTSIFDGAEILYTKKPTEGSFIKIPPRFITRFKLFKRKLRRLFKKVN